MTIKYPHTIENGLGETLIIKAVQQEPDGDRLIVENFVSPGNGPVMHTHWLQDEALTVIKGRLGYQIMGQEKQFIEEGDTVMFKRGVAHRFWNDGAETLHCKGWVKPIKTIEQFNFHSHQFKAIGLKLKLLPLYLHIGRERIPAIHYHSDH